ncbi:hypothetical protein BT96DRAFT_1022378 [Gymnopus androsaceus JB14]|uniref:Zn(2)-C6 fungal-type domain-containing protein n=1 Tax=Gymnopus androsaceus JB14 TaxID=1447944 RepID=A0A6A4H954_9AGAR|nr:hypothetical protein BT96DRAFT_1022378 [Gymnopus androsaceus JB14]
MNAVTKTRTPRNLNRATACSHCRRRKTKCDGKKPRCTQCQTRSKPGHELACEYPELGRSRKQTLEASISTLEKRIRELERPEPDEGPIKLYDPSNIWSGSSSSLDESSPASTGSSLLDSISEPSIFSTAFQEEIPPALGQRLLQAFVPHARSFGFFLNIDRFVSTTTLPLSLGDYSRPCPKPRLCHLPYRSSPVWGWRRRRIHVSFALPSPLRISSARVESSRENIIFLLRSASLHALVFINCDQASFTPNLMGIGGPSLPEPTDMVDEGERINAFWTAFTLCNCWGVGVGGFSSMMFESYGSRIDTPWPLDMEDYEQNRLPVNYIGESTVRNFLSRDPHSLVSGSSRMAMYAQSSLLLDRAANLASLFTNELHPDEHTRYMKTFVALDALIDSLHRSLPSLLQTPISSPDFVIVWATHLICCGASITLHNVFIDSSPFSRNKTLESAEGSLVLVRGKDLGSTEVNPIFGILWRIVGQAIIEEISRLDREALLSTSLGGLGDIGKEEAGNGIVARGAVSVNGSVCREVKDNRV